MKTLELKLKKDVLIVDLPYNYAYIEDIDINYFKNLETRGTIDISPGTIFICKGSELTEEIASELVDFWQNMANDGFIYENYKTNLPKKKTAVEAVISAIESKKFYWLVNPYGKEPECFATPYTDIYTIQKRANKHMQWKEAEEKTFRNPLIFVKK